VFPVGFPVGGMFRFFYKGIMMSVTKLWWALLGFLLLSLSGCGEEGREAANASAPAAAAQEHVDDADAGDDEGDEEEDGEDGSFDKYPFSREDFLQKWTGSCVETMRNLRADKKLEAAKQEAYCACVTEEVFGGLGNTRVEEWIKDASERSKMLEAFSKDPKNFKQDPAVKAELERRNKEWADMYTRSENACMKKLGVSVRLTYEGW
jgi:hypothetical protein